MKTKAESLRLILGIKLRQLRLKKKFSLKDLAERTNLSISFLSEIEKGKKYPKPEKLMLLAGALGVSFDELVSLRVDEELDPVTSVLNSPFMQGFPFEPFGISRRDIVDLLSQSPTEAGAFLRTFLEIAENYDMEVEHFFLAALRSYQVMHHNYFDEIERAVNKFFHELDLRPKARISLPKLRAVLRERYDYVLEHADFNDDPDLRGLRSVWITGSPHKLILNEKLLQIQEAFVIGRELGFCYLGLAERAATSSWIKVESFEQVLNNFKASYFAGALLINRDLLVTDLKSFFKKRQWDGEAMLKIMKKYGATPEMFLYRLSQLIPKFFNLNEIYYLRFFNRRGLDDYELTKGLNMSRVRVPHGGGIKEHYCRRWLSIKMLKELAARPQEETLEATLAAAQRLHFRKHGGDFFNITFVRPLALSSGTNSSITLGFLINDAFKRKIRFWNDPAVDEVEVNETCERCELTELECLDRVAPNHLYEREQRLRSREETVNRFMKNRQKIA